MSGETKKIKPLEKPVKDCWEVRGGDGGGFGGIEYDFYPENVSQYQAIKTFSKRSGHRLDNIEAVRYRPSSEKGRCGCEHRYGGNR